MRSLGASTRHWPWLPVLFALPYALLLLGNFRSVLASIHLNADVVSAAYIGELLPSAPDRAEVLLGNFPWYTALWFEQLTRDLPFHRELWQAAPYALSLIGVALLAWSAGRVAGRWAGAMVAIVLACAGPALLAFQFAWTFHSATWVHVVLLGAFLVACAGRGGTLGGPALHVACCVVLAAITAAGLASDRLLLVAGVVPFVLAGLSSLVLLGGRPGRWMAGSAAAVALVALAGAALITGLMDDAGVRAAAFDITLTGFDGYARNFRVFLESFTLLFNGDFGGKKPGFEGLLALACAGCSLVAIVALARSGRGRLGVALRAAAPTTPRASARLVYVAFWALAGVVLALAFLISSVPADKFSGRYIVGVGFAVAALAPLAALASGRRAQIALVAGICVIVTGSISSLVRRDLQDNPSQYPDGYAAGLLADFTGEEGLRHGYAGYWDAAALAWQSQGRIEVYPVWECPDRPKETCPFYLHRISSWYEPRRNARSFLVIDPLQPRSAPPIPDRRFGKPERVAQVAHLTVYVYGYDIASRFTR